MRRPRSTSQRFARLAQGERQTGALTGTSGSGTVVQLLTQMSNQLNNLAQQVELSRDQVRSLVDQYLNEDNMTYIIVGDAKSQLDRVSKFGYGKPVVLDKLGNPI